MRVLMALIMVYRYRVSYAYAFAVLTLMGQVDRGHVSEQDFMRRGMLLGELYPDDYKRMREENHDE
jgi:hypothetical protein